MASQILRTVFCWILMMQFLIFSLFSQWNTDFLMKRSYEKFWQTFTQLLHHTIEEKGAAVSWNHIKTLSYWKHQDITNSHSQEISKLGAKALEIVGFSCFKTWCQESILHNRMRFCTLFSGTEAVFYLPLGQVPNTSGMYWTRMSQHIHWKWQITYPVCFGNNASIMDESYLGHQHPRQWN